MPTLITLDDGSVRWDYDLPAEKPKAAKKAAAATKKNEES
jgi:hypothetical protein